MSFINFRDKVGQRLQYMIDNGVELFTADVDGDTLYSNYLSSFPEGTNPTFRTRTEHDCSCCKSFIRNLGNVVAIVDGKVLSIWDVNPDEDHFKDVADSMSTLVKSKPLSGLYRSTFSKISSKTTPDKELIKNWSHFYAELPNRFVDSGGAVQGNYRTTYEVFERSLQTITKEAVNIVLELIDQKSIYRGEEFKPVVLALKKALTDYNKLKDHAQRNIYLWQYVLKHKESARYRNTAIGTLLIDLSEGVDLEAAVKSFEQKVAPENYKRTTALVTQGMVDQARKKVAELGIEDSLSRRYARAEDLSVNNVLFVDRTTRKHMKDVFDDIKVAAKKMPKSMDKVQEISIEEFIEKIVPKAESLEVFVENLHLNNFVSLVAPEFPSAKNMLKWGNNFSWSYAGEVTDSIKERVKGAGGNVDGFMRVSLSWHNSDDLDLSVKTPKSTIISYSSKQCPHTRGQLDLDMNAYGKHDSVHPVENIFWKDRAKIVKGDYDVYVNQFNQRTTNNVGYEVQIDIDGEIYEFSHPQVARGKKEDCHY